MSIKVTYLKSCRQ